MNSLGLAALLDNIVAGAVVVLFVQGDDGNLVGRVLQNSSVF